MTVVLIKDDVGMLKAILPAMVYYHYCISLANLRGWLKIYAMTVLYGQNISGTNLQFCGLQIFTIFTFVYTLCLFIPWSIHSLVYKRVQYHSLCRYDIGWTGQLLNNHVAVETD